MVMYGGLVMESGNVAQVFADPNHPYTRGLLASVPDLRDDLQTRLTPIAGSPPDMLRPPSGCPFAPRCPQAMLVCAKLPLLFATEPGRGARCWLHPVSYTHLDVYKRQPLQCHQSRPEHRPEWRSGRRERQGHPSPRDCLLYTSRDGPCGADVSEVGVKICGSA